VFTDVNAALSEWSNLDGDEQLTAFLAFNKEDAEQLYRALDTQDRVHLILNLPEGQRNYWHRLLDLDDAVDLLQNVPEKVRQDLLLSLDAHTLHETIALLAYSEDEAGGLMNPRFSRVRPDLRVDEALSYLRRQALARVMLYYVYVLDSDQRLVGVVSLRRLFTAKGDQLVSELMNSHVVSVDEELDQERVSQIFSLHDLVALPVVDENLRMQGIITVDDVLDVLEEEATEDIQKFGGQQSLDVPYLQTGLFSMFRKRGGWLAVLFLGEMLTATAMGYFENEIAKNVMLALFIPLIISSGGNTGSQASTLVIRAMALGELRPGDWLRVMGREILAGLLLGALLGLIGFARVLLWHYAFNAYGPEFLSVAATVGLSLIGVVLFGTLSGSMLPFILKRVGFDPASASAPFVATLVDVTGLVIYFSMARLLMSGL
jgi:magnesium transporter